MPDDAIEQLHAGGMVVETDVLSSLDRWLDLPSLGARELRWTFAHAFFPELVSMARFDGASWSVELRQSARAFSDVRAQHSHPGRPEDAIEHPVALGIWTATFADEPAIQTRIDAWRSTPAHADAVGVCDGYAIGVSWLDAGVERHEWSDNPDAKNDRRGHALLHAGVELVRRIAAPEAARAIEPFLRY